MEIPAYGGSVSDQESNTYTTTDEMLAPSKRSMSARTYGLLTGSDKLMCVYHFVYLMFFVDLCSLLHRDDNLYALDVVTPQRANLKRFCVNLYQANTNPAIPPLIVEDEFSDDDMPDLTPLETTNIDMGGFDHQIAVFEQRLLNVWVIWFTHGVWPIPRAVFITEYMLRQEIEQRMYRRWRRLEEEGDADLEIIHLIHENFDNYVPDVIQFQSVTMPRVSRSQLWNFGAFCLEFCFKALILLSARATTMLFLDDVIGFGAFAKMQIYHYWCAVFIYNVYALKEDVTRAMNRQIAISEIVVNHAFATQGRCAQVGAVIWFFVVIYLTIMAELLSAVFKRAPYGREVAIANVLVTTFVPDVVRPQGARLCRTSASLTVTTPERQVKAEVTTEDAVVLQSTKRTTALLQQVNDAHLTPSEVLDMSKQLQLLAIKQAKEKDQARKKARDKKLAVRDVHHQQSLNAVLREFKNSFMNRDLDIVMTLYNVIYSQSYFQMAFNLGILLREVGCPLDASQILQLLTTFFSEKDIFDIAEPQAGRPKARQPVAEEVVVDEEEQDFLSSFFARYFHVHSKKQGFLVLGMMLMAVLFKDTKFSTHIADLRDFVSGKDFAVTRIVEHVMHFLAGKIANMLGYASSDVESDVLLLLEKDAKYNVTTTDGISYVFQYYPAYRIELLNALEKLTVLEKANTRGDYFTAERLRSLKIKVILKIEDCDTQSNERRVEPFIVALCSGPNVGKTTITKTMAEIATMALGLGVNSAYTTHLSETADGKFVVAKRGIVDMWDDLGMRDVTCAYFQIMEFANDVPMTLASADIKDKGKHKVDGILGIITSNYLDLGVNKCKNINNKSAFMRRIDLHVEMIVKADYIKQGLYNKATSMLNAERFMEHIVYDEDGNKIQPDAWTFRVSKVLVQGETFELQFYKDFHTTYDFFAYYREEFLKTRIRRTEALKNRMETKWCARCGLPQHVHTATTQCKEWKMEELKIVPYEDTRTSINRILSGVMKYIFHEKFQPYQPEIVEACDVEHEQTYSVRFAGRSIEVYTGWEIIKNLTVQIVALLLYYLLVFCIAVWWTFLTQLNAQMRVQLGRIWAFFDHIWYFALLQRIRRLIPDETTFGCVTEMFNKIPNFARRVSFMNNFIKEYTKWTPGLKAAFMAVLTFTIVKGAMIMWDKFSKPTVNDVVTRQMWLHGKPEKQRYPAFRSYGSPKRKFIDFANAACYQFAVFDTRDDLERWYAGETGILQQNASGFFGVGKVFITVKHIELIGRWIHFFPRDSDNDKIVSDFYVTPELCVKGECDWQYLYVTGTVSRPDLFKLADPLRLAPEERSEVVFLFNEVRMEDTPYIINLELPMLDVCDTTKLNYWPRQKTIDGHSGSLYLHARNGKYEFAHHEGLAINGAAVAKFLNMDELNGVIKSFSDDHYPVTSTMATDLQHTLKHYTMGDTRAVNPLNDFTDICGIMCGAAEQEVGTGRAVQVMFPTPLASDLECYLEKKLVSPSEAKQEVINPLTGEKIKVSPYAVRLAAIGERKIIDTQRVIDATDEYIDRLQRLVKVKEKRKPLDYFEVLNGRAEDKIKGVNMDSSAGFGRHGSKKNYAIRRDKGWFLNDETLAAVEKADKMYRAGNFDACIVKSSIKMDEMISETKMKAGKSRQVYVMNLEYLILSKKYLGPLLAVMADNQLAFECMVGANAASNDWDKIRSYVKSRMYTDYSSMDYSGYDNNIDGIIMEQAMRCMRYIAKYFCNYDEGDMIALDGILNMAMQPMLVYRNHFKMITTAEFSGHCATAQINSICNSIYQRACWSYCVEKAFDAPRNSETWKFDWHNLLVTYGDDALLARAHYAAHGAITGKLIQEGFAVLGQVVTSAHDKNLPPMFQNFEDMTFLKRSWKDITWGDYTFCAAPLDKQTIWKMLCYNGISKHVEAPEILTQVVENAYREMWMHGPEEFASFCDLMEPLCAKHNIKPRVGRNCSTEWTEVMRDQNFTTWTSGEGFAHL